MELSPVLIQVQCNQVAITEISNGHQPLIEKDLCSPSALPIVKWAGGKQWLAIAAKQLAPVGWT